MPRLADARQRLNEPPTPPTDIRAAELRATDRWILEEFSGEPDAWLVIDDQHVYPTEAIE